MASQGFYDWDRAGRPYGLIRPAKALQRILRGHGLTVYDYPNDAHLLASTPEDHTPFSVTGWPGTNARWLARGLDIMPRGDSYAHRKENADIARKLIADRNASMPGVMWIKYINWTDENGVCRQERWTPGHTTRSSTDKGHIHISGRSDADTDSRADTYDPLAIPAPVEVPDVDTEQNRKLQAVDSAVYFGLVQGQDTVELPPYPVGTPAVVRDIWIVKQVKALRAEQAAMRVVIDALAAAVQAGGGSVDTAAILAGVDVRLAALAAEQRDAVADLGEGGAAQVRADAS